MFCLLILFVPPDHLKGVVDVSLSHLVSGRAVSMASFRSSMKMSDMKTDTRLLIDASWTS